MKSFATLIDTSDSNNAIRISLNASLSEFSSIIPFSSEFIEYVGNFICQILKHLNTLHKQKKSVHETRGLTELKLLFLYQKTFSS